MGGTSEITSHTYFYYKIYFPSHDIIRTEPILLYDQTGTLLYTIGPNDSRVDYENGVWEVPGNERNETVEKISTASFWINYSSDKLQIDFNNVLFKISKSLIPDVKYVKVTADFEYSTALAPIDSGRNIFDGRWDTQAQVVFYAKPPSGYAFAVLDLGQSYNIQAIDLIHGFFKPDDRRSFDINNKYTLQYSTDNINYYAVCKDATNFNLSGGASVSFERDKLGDDFSARYFRLIINDMNKVEYGNGCWVASFVEFAAYQDVVLKGNAFLSPTTALNGAYVGSPLSGAGATVNLTVDDTTAFSTHGTAYLDEIAFTYGNKTTTLFQQCSGSGIYPAKADGTRIAADIESDTKLYDDDGILPKLQDKLFKVKDLNPYLDTQAKVEKRASDYLSEFLKDNHKATIETVYGPHYRIAQTVLVVDAINNVSRRYFIESLKGTERSLELTVSYYP
jgi:hypothetical protein